MAIYDLDRVMVNVSIRLDQYIIADMLTRSIRVSITKDGYATIKNERHHLVTLELLVRNWWIGLEKAKEMLKATTQDCISSDLLPLTRR